MYSILLNKETNTLNISSHNRKSLAKIHLNAGASVQDLTLNGHTIIQDLAPLKYSETYASSILFPFANRIKDGSYSYNSNTYQLEINQKEENNALHGLVYNKTFNVVSKNTTNTFASVLLEYNETQKNIGFPYTYSIQLEYILTHDKLSLNVRIKNTSSKAFPFTLGWHPYFISDNLKNSTLEMESIKKINIGDRNITTGIEDIDPIGIFNIKDKQLDDCWVLNNGNVYFNTPKYKLLISSTGKNNFLQAYTPPKLNTIAIEPTTGVSDSFNNKIGLETLAPNDLYTINWTLKIN